MDELSLHAGADGRPRCRWCAVADYPAYLHYHDHEWGFPVADERRLFEKICLEGFQSGLSWRTILTKRESFRAAFCGFDFELVAQWGAADIERLLQDARIVRHRGKIAATLNNAQRACELVRDEGSLAAYFWRFEEPAEAAEAAQLRSFSPMSIALSKDLKKRGWKFVGPTTAYAFMQAMGLVNDHASGCFVHAQVSAARRVFAVPA